MPLKITNKPFFSLTSILCATLLLFFSPLPLTYAAGNQSQKIYEEEDKYGAEYLKFTEKERKIVLEKLKEGKSLNLREQKIRLKILREQYPIDWYEDMFDFRDYDQIGLYEWCEDSFITRSLKCHPHKVIEHFTPQQIKSLILNSDYNGGWADYRIRDMVTIILAITSELDKTKNHPELLESKKEPIVINSLYSYRLISFSPSEIKTKYWGIYGAYYEKDTECTSYVNPASERDNCLDFSLSEIKALRKKNLILQYYDCTLSDMPGHPRCPVADGATELY